MMRFSKISIYPGIHKTRGFAVLQLVEALRYKPECRGCDS